MFICNLKINSKRLKRIGFTIGIILLAILLIFVCTKFFHTDLFFVNGDTCTDDSMCEVTSDNYTDVLKIVHDHLDEYIGQKIHFTGYVYRLSDFNEKNFVLARNMVISSDFQTVVVGFLCESDIAYKFKDFNWVEVEGTIVKGDYHGEIQVVKITAIQEAEKPNDEYVYPPSDDLIPTSTIL